VLLGVFCTASTLLLIPAWFPSLLQGTGWESPRAIWAVLALLLLGGAASSWLRYRCALRVNEADALLPTRGEALSLVVLSAVGAFWVAWAPPWRELVLVWAGVWLGCAYALLLRLAARHAAARRPAPPVETVMLSGLVLVAAYLIPGGASPPSAA